LRFLRAYTDPNFSGRLLHLGETAMELVVGLLVGAAIVSVCWWIGWLVAHWSIEPRKSGKRRAF
jgi:hypothetical protein